MAQRTVGVLLFPGFELLDVFGPLEAFGHAADWFRCVTVAEQAGPVTSAQGARAVADHGFDDCPPLDILLVPGGMGTRREVDNAALIDWIAARARRAETTTSVCTGAALLARAGVLDGRRATSNKRAFGWVSGQGPKVTWVRQARWVDDGDVLTSSGVSAGIDMALHLIGRLAGPAVRDEIATRMEYTWHSDAAHDPFAKIYGLA
jgi:transcriptional regulator GlxA family with amidase domain